MTRAVYFENTLVEVVARLVASDPAPSQPAESLWCGSLCEDPNQPVATVDWSKTEQTKIINIAFEKRKSFHFEFADRGTLIRRLSWSQGTWTAVEGTPQPWEAPVFHSWYKVLDDLATDSAFVMATDASKVQQADQLQQRPLAVGATMPLCIPMHAMLACCSWYGLERP